MRKALKITGVAVLALLVLSAATIPDLLDKMTSV